MVRARARADFVFLVISIAVLSTSVCCLKCNTYTVYEFRNNESLLLEEVLMQQPPSHEPPAINSNESVSALTCVNYTIHSGVYSLVAGINILGDSVVLKGIGNVVLRIGHNETGSAGMGNDPPGQQPSGPGLQFKNHVYVEITGVEIDGSSGLLTFKDIDTLVIQSSVFRNFDQGSLDILDCLNVEMEDCFFNNNGLQLVSTSRKFQGGSGGLSMQYTEDYTFIQNPSFLLRNVSFIQNNALTTRNATSTFSEVASGDDFTGRGGALFILLQSQQPVDGIIQDSLFDSNTADLYGGAIYLAFNKEISNMISIMDTIFRNNSAFYAGGGMMFSFQVGGNDVSTNSVRMTRCTVEENIAGYGGGAYIFISISSGRTDGDLGIFLQFNNCSFVSNFAMEYGAAIGVTALNIFESKEETKPSEINNCSFIDNVCVQGGVVSFAYFPFLFAGRNTLQNSTGPAIMIIGAKTHVQGNLTIVNTSINNADRGAMYITSHGQLEVKRDTKLFFVNNRGNLGAAMVISIPNNPTVYARSSYNPLCPLQYEDSRTVPDDWDGVVFTIDGNSAIVGSGVYANYLSLCSWVSETEPYFDDKKAYRWNTFNYRRSNRNSAHTANVSSSIFWVQTPATMTSVQNDPIEGYPGQTINIDIRGFSEAGSPTYGVWRLDENHEHLDFNPTVLISRNDLTDPVSTSFMIDDDPPGGNNTYRLTAKTLLVEESVSDSFVVRVRGCPPGRLLKNSSTIDNAVQYSSCVCDEERPEILKCGIKNVTLNDRLWAIETKDEPDKLYTYSCPPRHCQCYLQSSQAANSYCYNVFVEDSVDSLCTCGRSGILCGECSNNDSTGISVLLNNCVSCDDAFSTLIPLFIIADIIVIILILVLSLSFPSWLIPAIFYIQVLPLLTENFPTTFENVHPGMVYIASALSFYFPYDFCLYENMTTVVSYSLRFIPTILACIIIPIVVILRNHIYRPTTLHGVWLIVLLLYIPTLHASISVFNCPRIPITVEGVTNYEFRWYYNGSVTCFTDPDHGGLVLLGILGLILCLGLVPLSLLIVFNKFKFSRSFLHMSEALACHYKDIKWWSTIELVKRIPIVVFVTAFPLNSFPAFFTLTIYYFATGHALSNKTGKLSRVTVIKEDLDVFTISSSNTSSEEVHISDKCDLTLNTSSLTALLTPFYYLPLLIILTVGGFEIGYEVWKYVSKIRSSVKDGKNARLSNISRQFSLKHDVKSQRQKVTITDVSLDMKEFNDHSNKN